MAALHPRLPQSPNSPLNFPGFPSPDLDFEGETGLQKWDRAPWDQGCGVETLSPTWAPQTTPYLQADIGAATQTTGGVRLGSAGCCGDPSPHPGLSQWLPTLMTSCPSPGVHLAGGEVEYTLSCSIIGGRGISMAPSSDHLTKEVTGSSQCDE